MKKCCKCLIIKDLLEFSKSKKQKDGHCRSCKLCDKLNYETNKSKFKEYYIKNRNKIIENSLLYIDTNYDIVQSRRKKYRQKNNEELKRKNREYYNKIEKTEEMRQKRNLKSRTRRKEDPQFKLALNLRRRLCHKLKFKQKPGSAVKDLGCTLGELKLYLESKFQPGMNWENHNQTGWHVDHIVPLSKFDLTEREEFLKACHYTNLQPLWAIDNLKKGNR